MTTRQLMELLERIEHHHGGPVEVYFSDHCTERFYRVPESDLKRYHKDTNYYFTHRSGKASIPLEGYKP